MTTQTLQAISLNSQYKNYVPPVSERQLGWNKYANGLSIDTCANDAQRRGWIAANRDEAHAQVVEAL